MDKQEDCRNEIIRKVLDEAIRKREYRRMRLMQELEIIHSEIEVLTDEYNRHSRLHRYED